MGLESVTFISDLVVTNPVGATDPKSQGDDHIRNLKLSIKNTFPNITGAITLSHTQLNNAAQVNVGNTFTTNQWLSSTNPRLYFDDTNAGAGLRKFYVESDSGVWAVASASDADSGIMNAIRVTKNASGTITNIDLTGTAITLNSVAATDFARLSQQNTFTSSNPFVLSSGGPNIAQVNTAAGSGLKRWIIGTESDGDWSVHSQNDAGSFVEYAIKLGKNASSEVTAIDLTADAINLNGVASSDFSRLSQSNTFTGATQTISAAGAPKLTVTDTTNGVSTIVNADDTFGAIGTSTAHTLHLLTGNSSRLAIDSSGNFDFKTGTVAIGGNLTVASAIRATFGGDMLYTGIISPAALSASQNDYAPTGHATAAVIRLDPNGNSPAVITGLAGGVNGRRVTLMRIAGSTGTIQLSQENASSSAANRFCAAGASWALTTTFASLDLIYDGTISRWVPVGGIS